MLRLNLLKKSKRFMKTSTNTGQVFAEFGSKFKVEYALLRTK